MRVLLLIFLCFLGCFVLAQNKVSGSGNQKNEFFEPGKVWLDTDGNSISAHGAGLLYHEGVYYWYGETRTSFHTFPGFSCYSSTDLLNWKNEGYALVPVKDNPQHELYEISG